MIMNNRVYNILRDVAQIYLPALGTLYAALGDIWGFPVVREVVATVLAVDTALGTMLKISATLYQKSDSRFDGGFSIEPNEEGDALLFRLKEVNPDTLYNESTGEITLKRIKK